MNDALLQTCDWHILALDLDGTLTNSNKEITPRTREVLIAAQERGLRLVLASGRPAYGILPLAEELRMGEFGGYVLAYNGGSIISCADRSTLFAQTLSPDVYPYLYQCSKQGDFVILSYKDEYIVSEQPWNKYVTKEAFLNRMPQLHVDNFLDVINFPVPKCLIVGDPEPLAALEVEMSEHLRGQMEVYRSEPYFLELVPLGIDKANSLSALLRHLGLKREQLIAMGDGYNDISMIQYAGLGIAMANANEQVRSAADMVTSLTNDEDGVAYVVSLILKEGNTQMCFLERNTQK